MKTTLSTYELMRLERYRSRRMGRRWRRKMGCLLWLIVAALFVAAVVWAWGARHGAWGARHGAWGMGHGEQGMGHGAWGMGRGAWGVGHEEGGRS